MNLQIGSKFGYGDQRHWKVIAIQDDGIVALPNESESSFESDEKGCYADDAVFFCNEDIKDMYEI